MSPEAGAFDAVFEVLTAAEADRVTALYAPLADAVRELVDATIRTEADDDVVGNAPPVREAGDAEHIGEPPPLDDLGIDVELATGP